MTDALFEHVGALVGQIKGLGRQAHAEYSIEVEAVIRTQSRDAQSIERLLDGILDFCFDPAMLQLFKKLCGHYYAIDPVTTASYVHADREMWDDKRREEERE